MRTLSILSIALIVSLNSCKKDDDPKFTSAEGTWTYTTPDNHISIDFTLTKNGTTWEVTSPVMRVDGNPYETVVQTQDIAPPSLGDIRININDTKEPYPYPIDFADGTVSDDFTQIKVSTAVYDWPNGTDNNLTNITIKRK
jgi:hypothetical protein